MKTFLRSLLITTFLIPTLSDAQVVLDSHRIAAEALYDENQYPDNSLAIEQLALSMMATEGGKPEQKPEYERLFREIVATPEYREGKISGYIAAFSENELRLLLELVRHPGYKLYLRRASEYQQVSSKALVHAFQLKREEIIKRYGHLFKK